MTRLFLAILLVAPLLGTVAEEAPPQLLANPGFERGGGLASGWYENTWGNASADWSKSEDPVHGGDRAQRIDVWDLGDGGALLAQEHDFFAGRVYEAEVWLRAETEATVVFVLQSRRPDYEVGARRTVRLGPEWRQVVIRGGFGNDGDETPEVIEGRLAVMVESTGAVFVDDASLRDVTAAALTDPVVNTAVVPAQFFGMHVNKLGVHETWPPIGVGTLRLWDTGTNWARIEPEPDVLQDPAGWEGPARRIERYVTYAEEHVPDAHIIYTMGMTPEWAGPDRTLPPDDLEDWRRYVRAVAERFQGRIGYWEIWNEANIARFWQGSMEDLVELTRIASEELRNVDPANALVAPDFTTVNRFEEFLAAGGGEYVDVLAFHEYPSLRPEDSVPLIVGYRDAAAAYGMGDVPLWNTEGAVTYDPASVLDEAAAAGAVARAYLVQWAAGVTDFNWYAWDIYEDRTRGFVPLSESVTPDDYAAVTSAGTAYRQTAGWLTGARMTSGAVSGPLWTVTLEQADGTTAWVVWSSGDSVAVTLPAEWAGARVHDLAGGISEVAGPELTVGASPLLLEPVADGTAAALVLPDLPDPDPEGHTSSGTLLPLLVLVTVAAAGGAGAGVVVARRRNARRA
ncbi:MAG: hypothetical protein PVI35_05985 [Acidimicrobiia bacterium]